MTIVRHPLSAFPSAVHDEVCKGIAEYMVGLTRLTTVDGVEQSILIGTGSLITVSDHHCILTAEHVLRELRTGDRLSLITSFSGGLRRYVFEQPHLQVHKIARGNDDYFGPDIGVIVLPKSGIGNLRSEKIFYNVDKRAHLFAGTYFARDFGFWFTFGILGETKTDMLPEGSFASVTGYQGICGVAAGPEYTAAGEYDYVEVQVTYADSTEADLPKSFGGVSGGGIWQVSFRQTEDGSLAPVDYVLSGVVFYQTGIADGVRRLRCHGPKTVHETVPTYVRSLPSAV